MTQHYSCDIAIIGASFAWISSYLTLRQRLGDSVNIRLFDMRAKFTYIPGLHRALCDTARLRSLQFDYAEVFGEDFVLGKIHHINHHHELRLENGKHRSFRFAIIATGSRSNFFGNKNIEKYGLTVRHAEDIPVLNNALETAQSVTVVGWWFTGIEVASVLAERWRRDRGEGYHWLVPAESVGAEDCGTRRGKRQGDSALRLVHSQKRLIQHLDPQVWKRCFDWLTDHGVEVILDDRLHDMDSTSVVLWSGKTIASDITILSAGNTVNDESHAPQLTFDNSYRALESDNIMMCGDVAIHGLYATAHNAFLEGRRIWQLIADAYQGIHNTSYRPLKNFDIFVIALGSHDGVFVRKQSVFFLPKIAWLMKKMIEIKVLWEFKNKLMLPF